MPPEVSIALKSVIVPTLIPAVVLLVCWRPWSRKASAWSWAAGVAIALGVAVGATLIRGWPGVASAVWPSDVTRFVPHAALAGAVVGLIVGRGFIATVAGHVLRFALSFGLVWIITGPIRRHEWDGTEPLLWIAGLTLLAGLSWVGVHHRARLGRGRDAGLALFIVTVGVAAALTVSGSASLGQVAGTLAAGLAVAWVMLSIRRRGAQRGRSLAPGVDVAGAVLVALLLSGFFYISETPPVGAYVRLMLAPAVLWVDRIPWVAHRPVWVRAGLRYGLLVLLVADAVRVAMPEAAEPGPGGDAGSLYY